MTGFWTEAHAGALLFLLLALLLLVLSALSLLESNLLSHRLRPITERFRDAQARWPWAIGLVMFGLGYLAGHLFSPG